MLGEPDPVAGRHRRFSGSHCRGTIDCDSRCLHVFLASAALTKNFTGKLLDIGHEAVGERIGQIGKYFHVMLATPRNRNSQAH